MEKYQALRVFREVARHRGFSAAGRSLNLSTPSVSRLIGDLEAHLGVRLFDRSPRRVALTEEGERLMQTAVPLFEELEAVTEGIRAAERTPRGHLRISSSVAFGQDRIAPAIPAFRRRHPEVTVELDLSNRIVDLIHERVDVAVRVGSPRGLATASLKARRIYGQRQVFVATPAYVSRFGAPEAPEELVRHSYVKHVSGRWGVATLLERQGEGFAFSPPDGFLERRGEGFAFSPPDGFLVSSVNASKNVILTGQAIGLLPDYIAGPLIQQGELTRILPDISSVEEPIYAVFVHKSYMPAKVRAFIDHLVATLGAEERD